MGQLFKLNQTNFTSGVLDPKLAAREDITFYYNGLADGENAIILPQGGFDARPGMQFLRQLSPVLSEVSLSGATVTAPEGGTDANLHDDDNTTVATTSGNIGTTNPFVVAHVDFGAAQSVSAVDIENIALSAGSLDDEFFVQYSSDDASWTNFGAAFNVDASNRSRRQRNETGAVSARYWRAARVGSTDTAATVSIGEIRFWEETSTLSNARLFPFAYQTSEAYMFALSDRNIDIMNGTAYAGSISIPHTSAQLPVANFTQSLDTMLIFHKNVQPWRIFRQGAVDEFDFRYQDFTNIPQYDYGAGTGGANEVQVLNDAGGFASGDDITILLEGERTTVITAGATRNDTATAIQTALRALANTSSDGITVADASGSDGFDVTFAGDDGKQPWSEMSVSVLTGSSIWSVSRTTKGEPEGEDIMSDDRGWPRCGAFHQSRLMLGGILGVPDAFLSSTLGDRFDFDIDSELETKAIMVRAETDQVSAIYNIVVGRNVSIFTNDGEFYIPESVIDQNMTLKLTTDSGSKEGIRVTRVEGALVFIQGVQDESDASREIGTSNQEFIFEETQQAYTTNIVSKFSSHLLNNPVDKDYRKALNTSKPALELIVNEDGTGVIYTILRKELVNAMIPNLTRSGDKLLAVAVDKNRRVFWVTERSINGETVRYIEMWNDNLYLDCGGIETMTYEEVTATADDQAAYNWTFTSPSSAAEIIVRINGGRLDTDEYTVTLGSKQVTLAADIAAAITQGDVVRIAYGKKTVTGVDHLEGETIKTYVDGTQGDDVTVSGGSFTLADYADTEIQYGFDYSVRGELMPGRVPENESLVGEEMPVANVYLNLYRTAGIQIRVNGRTSGGPDDDGWIDVPLQKFDDAVLDKSNEELLFTGEKEIEGLLEGDNIIGAPCEFRRPGPGPFTVLGITREVSL